MKITRVRVDIGKNMFHLCAVNQAGKIVWRKALKRHQWIDYLESETDAGIAIGMEACGGAHHWARALSSRGYLVKLIAPQFVKPYVKSNKTDHADAEAIAEAMSRPEMRFVPAKTVDQQDIQAVHRIRDEVIKRRTALGNQIRGLAAEYGLIAPQSNVQLRRALAFWLEDSEIGLSLMYKKLLHEQQKDLLRLDERVEELDQHIKVQAKENRVAHRLQQLRGVGPVCATILASALGDGTSFKNGREFAASLGLTPRQHSTGGKERILGITKRGDSYIRKQLIHGARSTVSHAQKREDSLSLWLNRLSARKHRNVVTVALAAKTARMAWSLARYEVDYDPTRASMQQCPEMSAQL